MAKKNAAPVAEPITEETPPAPQFAADAGAVFQQDRSGHSRQNPKSEGEANFAAFSALIREAAGVTTEEPTDG